MNRARGFTLLEILIALSVFALLATLTSSAMYHAFTTRSRVTAQADRLADLQRTMAFIQQDTQQIMPRAVQEILFIGKPDEVRFTRGGVFNTTTDAQSALQRVAYLCKKGELIRRHWPMLDTPSPKIYTDKTLLTNLSNCKMAYLSPQAQLTPNWEQNNLPRAIQFSFDVIPWGNMSVLFAIPSRLYVQ